MDETTLLLDDDVRQTSRKDAAEGAHPGPLGRQTALSAMRTVA